MTFTRGRSAFAGRVFLTPLLAATLAVAVPAGAGEAGPVRVAVEQAGSRAVPVPAWDPASPQRLVRVDGALYQQTGGNYFRVIDETITVRLAPGLAGWSDLVARASRRADRFAVLADLEPLRSNRLGIVDLRLPHGSPEAWCELVFATGLVRYAEVNTLGVYEFTPNDPLYPQQWALNNTGQTGGTPGADVSAESAWDLTAGDPSVVIGVLDSGTSIDHPDLAPNVWHNEDEIPGNGSDDDGNGFVDDWEGWDFGNGNNDPRSNSFHGTHVTGVINAVGDNGQGIAGLAGGRGGPGVRAMALAVGESFPIGSILDDAILYAADNGAHVITMSLSVGQSQAIDDALDYAYNVRDVFIDCAAGNNGPSVNYPATRPEVMAVASTDDDDDRSSFSNPGTQLEIAAPGSSILSTQLGGSYGSSSGTSFAAPYVAALAGLVRSLNPGLGAPEVRQLIIDSADDVESPGFDSLTGWGRINAFQALSLAGSSVGTVELDRGTYTCSDLISITVSDFDLAGSGSLQVTLRSDSEPAGETVVLVESGNGTFGGTMLVESAAPVVDGVLQATHGETIAVDYVDADDGQGGVDVPVTATAQTDCQGPAISGVEISVIGPGSAGVSWTTDEPGSSTVVYGDSVPPGQQVMGSGLVTRHTLFLTGLEECSVYRFEIRSDDALGNASVDDNGGEYHAFQTYGTLPGGGSGPCESGQVFLDRGVYGCSETAAVTVTDIDLDADPGGLDTVQVLLTSTSEPDGEWITLTELDLSSAFFEGTIDLAPVGAGPDGMLAVAPGDLITATYQEADDGQGQADSITVTAVADCTSPVILDLEVHAISATRAEIAWSTDEPATSRIDFGGDATLGSTVEDGALKVDHRLAVSAFDACAPVFFRVSSTDSGGAAAVADVQGQPLRFNLNRIGGLIFHDNFETFGGWTMEGEWERAAPQGLGSDSGDPQAAYSGVEVLGTDLGGSGSVPGDYETSGADQATSPPFSTAGVDDVELIFRRKLGLAAGDTAKVLLQGLFSQVVWATTAAVDDPEWVEFRLGLPSAGNQSAVRVGFSIQGQVPVPGYGWNIDELIVKEASQPDYLSCGGCVGEPGFAGLGAVTDPDPCAPGGLRLEWQPAAAWGTGSGGSYDVHRGTTPGFIPDAGNRIASGITEVFWVDAGAPVDTEVWYVVRARNDESCAGGEGLADANLVYGSATETVAQSPPSGIGSSLRVRRVGGAHVRLDWEESGSASYSVRRSDEPDFDGAAEVGTTEGSLYEDVGAQAAPGLYAYRVVAVNACGQE